MQEHREIFRARSLERLSSPERLDELMHVTSMHGWISLAAFWGVVVVAVVWGFYGSIPTIVKGQGILIKDGGVQIVESPAAGQVSELYVQAGATVLQDQVIARIFQQGDAGRDGGTNRTIVVTSPYAGRVLEVRVIRGNVIQSATPIVSLEVAAGSLEGVLYLSPIDGKKVRPGMDVRLSPAPVKKEEYGMLVGRVTRVGELPASPAAMRRVLGSDELVRSLTAEGPPIQVHVELARSPWTRSGFSWTSTTQPLMTQVSEFTAPIAPVMMQGWLANLAVAPGPPAILETGTPSEAQVIVDEDAPISLVLGRLMRAGS